MKLTKRVIQAESWYGVTHAVPRRGTAAHRKMMRAYDLKHPRKNPIKTAEGRVLHPENCPIPLAASMVSKRRGNKRNKRARFANCTYESAEYTIRRRPANAGSKFSGHIERGHVEGADRYTRSRLPSGKYLELSYWAKGREQKAAQATLRKVSRLLGWWPSSGK